MARSAGRVTVDDVTTLRTTAYRYTSPRAAGAQSQRAISDCFLCREHLVQLIISQGSVRPNLRSCQITRLLDLEAPDVS